jgi:hypothetical protein
MDERKLADAYLSFQRGWNAASVIGGDFKQTADWDEMALGEWCFRS